MDLEASDFQADLEAAVHVLMLESLEGERKRANGIATSARRYAPRAAVHDPREPVLAESVEVTEGTDEDGNAVFEVGSPVAHGVYQEFGTSLMGAHPWFRPAIQENS
jgi:hypothetical protein